MQYVLFNNCELTFTRISKYKKARRYRKIKKHHLLKSSFIIDDEVKEYFNSSLITPKFKNKYKGINIYSIGIIRASQYDISWKRFGKKRKQWEKKIKKHISTRKEFPEIIDFEYDYYYTHFNEFDNDYSYVDEFDDYSLYINDD